MATTGVLDKVYTTFSNLDRDYARSKKTRTEFITDKFGGQLDIGSMIILDAVGADVDSDSPEDIEKLTFIKNIFDKLLAAQDTLDNLPDFQFTNGALFAELLNVVQNSIAQGYGFRYGSQSEVHHMEKGCVHFVSKQSDGVCAPMSDCKVFHAYNEHMQGYANLFYRSAGVDIGEYYERTGKNLKPLAPENITKKIK